jgi:hypothetical protein
MALSFPSLTAPNARLDLHPAQITRIWSAIIQCTLDLSGANNRNFAGQRCLISGYHEGDSSKATGGRVVFPAAMLLVPKKR